MAPRNSSYFYGAALLSLIADQLSKLWVSACIPFSASISILPGVFNLTHILNPGAAFGLFSSGGLSFRNPFFVGISLVALFFIFLYFWKYGSSNLLSSLALGLISGGALGNLVDRLRQGAVVDFIDLHVGRFHWPAFNLADSAITIGAALMVWELGRGSRR